MAEAGVAAIAVAGAPVIAAAAMSVVAVPEVPVVAAAGVLMAVDAEEVCEVDGDEALLVDVAEVTAVPFCVATDPPAVSAFVAAPPEPFELAAAVAGTGVADFPGTGVADFAGGRVAFLSAADAVVAAGTAVADLTGGEGAAPAAFFAVAAPSVATDPVVLELAAVAWLDELVLVDEVVVPCDACETGSNHTGPKTIITDSTAAAKACSRRCCPRSPLPARCPAFMSSLRQRTVMLAWVAPCSETIRIDKFRPPPSDTPTFDVELPPLTPEVGRMVRSAQPSPLLVNVALNPRPPMSWAMSLSMLGSAPQMWKVPGPPAGAAGITGVGGMSCAMAGGSAAHGALCIPPSLVATVVSPACMSPVVIVVFELSSAACARRMLAPAATWPQVTWALEAHSASEATATLHANRLLLRGLIACLLREQEEGGRDGRSRLTRGRPHASGLQVTL
ncbi:MAG TPA: hypothetical protein VKV73_23930 [Chloroflexota bacterium]|nr:hypothetical protein [Chloroflexota bacterium]